MYVLIHDEATGSCPLIAAERLYAAVLSRETPTTENPAIPSCPRDAANLSIRTIHQTAFPLTRLPSEWKPSSLNPQTKQKANRFDFGDTSRYRVKANEHDVIVYRSLNDFEANTKIARVFYDDFQKHLKEVPEVEAILYLLIIGVCAEQLSSKVMGHVRFGLAAGCVAVAMPGRKLPDYSRAPAPGPGLALRIYGAKHRTRGIAPKYKRHPYGGA